MQKALGLDPSNGSADKHLSTTSYHSMQTRLIVLVLLSSVLIGGFCRAQVSSSFPSLVYSHSASSIGLGDQAVASRNAIDAMQFNPANLVYTEGLELSFFRNPLRLVVNDGVPLTSVVGTLRLDAHSAIGFSCTNLDYGSISSFSSTLTTPESSFHSYERSLELGYSYAFSERFSLGAKASYVWEPLSGTTTAEHLLLSAGTSWRPEILADRVQLGLALTNFGTGIEFGSSELPPPARIDAGIEALAVSNDVFDVSVALSATKPMEKLGDAPTYDGESSFKALFSDWNDFPNDVTGRVGLAYAWRPVNLGAGVSFFERAYLGYFSAGPKSNELSTFFTHGIQIGMEFHGVAATAGYAGRWHNNNQTSYLEWAFPWETFQFTIASDMPLFGRTSEERGKEGDADNVIISAAYSHPMLVGRWKGWDYGGSYLAFSMNPIWSFEADFYLSKASALITSVEYTRIEETSRSTLTYGGSFIQNSRFVYALETAAIESGFRYHPLEAFRPLFVQAALGIIRINPVEDYTYPRYLYETFDRLTLGCCLSIGDLGITAIPKLSFRTIFMDGIPNSNRLVGNNLFEAGVNVGYRF